MLQLEVLQLGVLQPGSLPVFICNPFLESQDTNSYLPEEIYRRHQEWTEIMETGIYKRLQKLIEVWAAATN